MLLQIAQTAVLARILSPEEFGLMAIIGVMLASFSVVTDFGISKALIYFDSTQDERSTLYWLNLAFAVACMLILASGASLAGRLYDAPQLMPALQLGSLALPLAAIGQQFRALAEKEMRFLVLGKIDIASTIVSAIVGVSSALLGAGVYALVLALLAKSGSNSLLAWTWLSAGQRPAFRFSLGNSRKYIRYGVYLVGDSLVNTINRDGDVWAGSAAAGSGVGYYTVPRDLSIRVATAINPIVTKVGFPLMSRLKSDPKRLQSAYIQTLRMTASINFPIYAALGLFAGEVVAILYGPQWKDSAIYLQVLAAWGLVRSTGNPVGSLLYAVGAVRRSLLWNLGMLGLIPLYFVAARDHGLWGLALAVLSAQLMIFVPLWMILVRPCCGLPLRGYLGSLLPPAAVTVAAEVAAWATTLGLRGNLLVLALGGLTGMLVYLGLSWLFNRPWMEAMLELFYLRKLEAK